MNNAQQQFLNDLDRRLWNAADRLRSNVNPSDYMHVVLGLVFLKYVSDAFGERRAELLEPPFPIRANDYYLGDDASELIEQELEARDYYTGEERLLGARAGPLGLHQGQRQGRQRHGAAGQERQGLRVRVQEHRPPARRCARSRREGQPQAERCARQKLRPLARGRRPAGPDRRVLHRPVQPRLAASQGHPRPRLRILPGRVLALPPASAAASSTRPRASSA
jgi:hypothetical protein